MLTESPAAYEPNFSPVAVSDDRMAEMNEAMMDLERADAELNDADMEYLARLNTIDVEAADRDLALAALLETVPAAACVSLQKSTIWLRSPDLAGVHRSDWWAAVVDLRDGRESCVGTGGTPAEAAQGALAELAAVAKAA